MKDELADIVKKSLKIVKKTGQKLVVMDIGANDGTLLKNYSSSVFKVGVEPVRKFAMEAKKYSDIIVNDYYSYQSLEKTKKNLQADIITIISCFYDIDKPNEFMEDVKKALNEDGICVIQQNYLAEMLKQNAFDNIVHEHLEYYSLLSLSNLLTRHGLEIFDAELRSLNGGSFRTYIAFKGKKKITKRLLKLIESEKELKLNNKKTYVDFANRIKKNNYDILNFIAKLRKSGKTVYLYGASTRGNTLLQYIGLNNKLIQKAVERNPEKWGKKIMSVGIPIISEQQARTEKPDYMLVLPWFFKQEFLKREKSYLKQGGQFIFPLPKLAVVKK
jgi:hypothetical protein